MALFSVQWHGPLLPMMACEKPVKMQGALLAS